MAFPRLGECDPLPELRLNIGLLHFSTAPTLGVLDNFRSRSFGHLKFTTTKPILTQVALSLFHWPSPFTSPLTYHKYMVIYYTYNYVSVDYTVLRIDGQRHASLDSHEVEG